ncbi:MAG: 16S rRNA (guanine(966)-N(2))-methyltransferase RsmD [Actinomycetota bacterium]|nr:16S rRNA (guanine(966)-N(2))-methyltransferase RsmD [Actinomycetota bacterium]
MTRIIGGVAGGRRLSTPTGAATRPTSDRVREALFSVLESRLGSLAGLRFLDLYAGAGGIGLEAVSRGAGVLTAVESDKRTTRLVEGNARALGLSRVEVLAAPVERVLAHPPRAPYDVVYLDPPYSLAQAALEEVLALLVANGWAAVGTVVVLERSTRSVEPAWPTGLVRERAKKYGETVLWFVRVDAVKDQPEHQPVRDR